MKRDGSARTPHEVGDGKVTFLNTEHDPPECPVGGWGLDKDIGTGHALRFPSRKGSESRRVAAPLVRTKGSDASWRTSYVSRNAVASAHAPRSMAGIKVLYICVGHPELKARHASSRAVRTSYLAVLCSCFTFSRCAVVTAARAAASLRYTTCAANPTSKSCALNIRLLEQRRDAMSPAW